MSKLYTKEMFLIAAEKCEVSMIDAQHIMQYIDEYVTPIQLPTDEEVENQASKYSRIESISTQGLAGYYFEMGAKWMRDKIQGGQE